MAKKLVVSVRLGMHKIVDVYEMPEEWLGLSPEEIRKELDQMAMDHVANHVESRAEIEGDNESEGE